MKTKRLFLVQVVIMRGTHKSPTSLYSQYSILHFTCKHIPHDVVSRPSSSKRIFEELCDFFTKDTHSSNSHFHTFPNNPQQQPQTDTTCPAQLIGTRASPPPPRGANNTTSSTTLASPPPRRPAHK